MLAGQFLVMVSMTNALHIFFTAVDRVVLCVVHAPDSTDFAKNSENVLRLSSRWIIVHFFQHNYLSICSNQSPRSLRQRVARESPDTYLVHGVETKNKPWLLNAVNVVMCIILQLTRVRDHQFETLRNFKFIHCNAPPLALGPVPVTDNIKQLY
jgi:hypothetical protein